MDFHDKTVVVTGTFARISRADAEAKLRALGAIVTGSVSRGTDLVFAGDKAGSKLTKARAYGVQVLGEEALIALLSPGGAAAACFASPPDADASGADLVAWLDTASWENFSAERDLPPLRAALLTLEVREGVGPAHRLATARLRERLGEGMRLLHPAGHDVDLSSVGLSPDGRHLATGSWVGEDYDAGGWLQVWELATGRCVNRLRGVTGGVGWPDYAGCIQWRPDGQKLGLAFDTNGVGLFDPWGERSEPEGCAYITDGWSRPPSFCWSPDGQDVYIACWGPDGELGARLSLNARSPVPRWFDKPRESAGHVEPLRRVFWPDAGHILGWNAHDQLVGLSPEGQLQYVRKAHRPVALRPDGAELVMAPAGLVFHDPGAGTIRSKLPTHTGAGELVYSPDSQRLAALVFPQNEDGAAPGLQLFRDGRFEVGYALRLKAPIFSQPDARAFAWSPDSQRGAALGEDDTLHLLQLGDPVMPQCSIGVPQARGVLWGQDGLVAWGSGVLYFVDPATGALRGRFHIAREAEGERPLALNGVDLGASLPDNPSFALDDQRWAAALGSGAVIGPAEPALIDGQVAYTIGNRWAWPWRWGEARIFADAASAARDGGLPPALARRFKKAPVSRPARVAPWPPADPVTVDDLVELMWSDIRPLSDDLYRPDYTRRLARLELRLGRPGAVARMREVSQPRFRCLGLSEAAVLLADSAPDTARALVLEAEQSFAEAGPAGRCAMLAGLGAAWVRLGDRARGDQRLSEARASLLSEDQGAESYNALAQAQFWARRPEDGLATLAELMRQYSGWGADPAFHAFVALQPSWELLQRFLEAARDRDVLGEIGPWTLGFRLLISRGEHPQALAWCEAFRRLYTRDDQAVALAAWACADRDGALAWLDSRLQGSASREYTVTWLNKVARIDPAWVVARWTPALGTLEGASPYERDALLVALGELERRCPALGLTLDDPGWTPLQRLRVAQGRLTALEPGDPAWLAEMAAARTANAALAGEHAMLLAGFAWRAERPDLYAELVATAREATHADAYRDIGLEYVASAQASLGDLAGAVQTWRLIPKAKRSYRVEPLLRTCAHRGELAGLLDLLKTVPEGLHGRARAVEQALERILGLLVR